VLSSWRFFVTGSNRGLGLGLVTSLLNEGASVLAYSRRTTAHAQLTRDADACRPRLLLYSGCVLQKNRLESALQLAHRHFGGLDVLIANAAVFGPREPFQSCNPEEWEHSVTNNIMGLTRTVRACIPALVASGRGQVIVIGSAIRQQPSINSSAYAVSKAMTWALVQSLSLELESVGIAVNELIPGPTLTDMNPGAGSLSRYRLPDSPDFLQLIRFLCLSSPPPSGQSFSLRFTP